MERTCESMDDNRLVKIARDRKPTGTRNIGERDPLGIMRLTAQLLDLLVMNVIKKIYI